MALNKELKVRRVKYFLLLALISLTLAKALNCPKGEYYSIIIDSCTDCPENPEKNCENEGVDKKSCQEGCIEGE